jgi:hypothetical protein
LGDTERRDVRLILQEIDTASRLFCARSADLLKSYSIPVEYLQYQVEALFINFSVSSAKKGCREGPGSGILEEFLVKATISQQQYLYQNYMKIT